MDLLKNIIYLVISAISIGATLFTVFGIFFHFKYKLKSHDIRINNLEKQNGSFEKTVRITNRKLGIIEKNLIRLMEKQKLEPVRDLFKEEEDECL